MKRLGRIVLFALLAGVAWPAFAGSFSVDPIRLELAGTHRATSLTVSHHGQDKLLLQVSVFRWSRENDEDVLTPVSGPDAPIVTPPLFRLSGKGASQIVRIGFRNPMAPGESENHWRVVVEELPQPTAQSETDRGPLAIAMHLRISLPLFRQPAEIKHQLLWDGEVAGDLLRLKVDNAGTVTERIDELVLTGPTRLTALAKLAGPLYVFPGEQRSFELKPLYSETSRTLHLHERGTFPLMHELVFRAQ